MINNLINVIRLRQLEIGASLASGNASTWETYQRMVGENQGMQYVLDYINRMLEEERNQE
jgi:hypothetical protein